MLEGCWANVASCSMNWKSGYVGRVEFEVLQLGFSFIDLHSWAIEGNFVEWTRKVI